MFFTLNTKLKDLFQQQKADTMQGRSKQEHHHGHEDGCYRGHNQDEYRCKDHIHNGAQEVG